MWRDLTKKFKAEYGHNKTWEFFWLLRIKVKSFFKCIVHIQTIYVYGKFG